MPAGLRCKPSLLNILSLSKPGCPTKCRFLLELQMTFNFMLKLSIRLLTWCRNDSERCRPWNKFCDLGNTELSMISAVEFTCQISCSNCCRRSMTMSASILPRSLTPQWIAIIWKIKKIIIPNINSCVFSVSKKNHYLSGYETCGQKWKLIQMTVQWFLVWLLSHVHPCFKKLICQL